MFKKKKQHKGYIGYNDSTLGSSLSEALKDWEKFTQGYQARNTATYQQLLEEQQRMYDMYKRKESDYEWRKYVKSIGIEEDFVPIEGEDYLE